MFTMYKKILGITVVSLGVFAQFNASAATVHTPHGTIEGRVIVRQFDRTVITILTAENQIFQFQAPQIDKITSQENNLIGRSIILRQEPVETSDSVVNSPLAKGLEVSIQEAPQDSEWVKVQAWGNHVGWIPKMVLTTEVDQLEEPAKQQEVPAPLPKDEDGEQEAVPAETAPQSIQSATTPAPEQASESIRSGTTPIPEQTQPAGDVQNATTPPVPDDEAIGGNIQPVTPSEPIPSEPVESVTQPPVPGDVTDPGLAVPDEQPQQDTAEQPAPIDPESSEQSDTDANPNNQE